MLEEELEQDFVLGNEDQNRLMNLDKDNLVRLDKEDLVMIKTLDMDRLQSSMIYDHGQEV